MCRALSYGLAVRNRRSVQIQQMRALLLRYQSSLVSPVFQQVVDGAVVQKYPARQARDEDRLGAQCAELLNHDGEVRAHRLGRRDLLVVVPELERHVGVLTLRHLRFDRVHYEVSVLECWGKECSYAK